MSLTFINDSASNLNPNANTQTLSYNNSTGTFLMTVMCMPNNRDFTGCTYDGVAMIDEFQVEYGGLGERLICCSLQNPSTGTNNLVVSFTGLQNKHTSIYVSSWTNCAGIGNTASNGSSSTPNSKTLTVSANSRIYLTGLSSFAQSFPYTINGSDRTARFNGHSIGNTSTVICEGALSASGLPAGSITCITKADAGNITNARIELMEGTPPPAGRRRIIIT